MSLGVGRGGSIVVVVVVVGVRETRGYAARVFQIITSLCGGGGGGGDGGVAHGNRCIYVYYIQCAQIYTYTYLPRNINEMQPRELNLHHPPPPPIFFLIYNYIENNDNNYLKETTHIKGKKFLTFFYYSSSVVEIRLLSRQLI